MMESESRKNEIFVLLSIFFFKKVFIFQHILHDSVLFLAFNSISLVDSFAHQNQIFPEIYIRFSHAN